MIPVTRLRLRSRSPVPARSGTRVAAVLLAVVVVAAGIWAARTKSGPSTAGSVSIVVSDVSVNGHPTRVLATGTGQPLYINRIDMPFAQGCVWLKVACDPAWLPVGLVRSERLEVRGLPTDNGYPTFLAMASIGSRCLVEFHGHILYTRAVRTANYPVSVGADWTIATPSLYPYSWEAIAFPSTYQNTNCPTQ